MGILNQKFKLSEPKFEVTEAGCTKCTLEARLNLREFERRYMIIPQQFIKNRMSMHIPVVYSVFSMDYESGEDRCRAKYLLRPDGTAVVMKIDREYYSSRGRGYELPRDRRVVKASSRIKVRRDENEWCRYDYTTTVSVSATARCHEDDTFDEEFGKALSFSRAYVKLYKKVFWLFCEIASLARMMADDAVIPDDDAMDMHSRCLDFLWDSTLK